MRLQYFLIISLLEQYFLSQTSERIVAESCDPSLGVRIMGNAPVGFFKYKYPKEVRSKGYIGAKVRVFIYHIAF